MDRTLENRMEEARAFFTARAEEGQEEEMRRVHEYCADMAEGVRETARLVDYLKTQLDDVRHVLGRHVEVSGTVPHTHRPGPTGRR